MLLEISQRLWNLSQHGLEIMRQPYCQWHRAPPTPGRVPSWIAWWEATRYLLLQWLHLTPQPPQDGYRSRRNHDVETHAGSWLQSGARRQRAVAHQHPGR